MPEQATARECQALPNAYGPVPGHPKVARRGSLHGAGLIRTRNCSGADPRVGSHSPTVLPATWGSMGTEQRTPVSLAVGPGGELWLPEGIARLRWSDSEFRRGTRP